MMKASRRASGLILIVVSGLAFGRCGGGGSAGPTQPPVTVPATPTPAPTAVADPPLSTELQRGCRRATRTRSCRIEPSDYQTIVDRSIRTLQAEQPALFEGDQVLSTGAYYVGLIKVLDRQGICAVFDGEELAVTDRPTSSEQFHVLTSASRARFGPQSYRTTCSPFRRPAGRGSAAASARRMLAALEPGSGLRPRELEPLHQRHDGGDRTGPEGEARPLQLRRHRGGHGLAGREEPRGLPRRRGGGPDSRRATARRTTARRSRSSRARTP